MLRRYSQRGQTEIKPCIVSVQSHNKKICFSVSAGTPDYNLRVRGEEESVVLFLIELTTLYLGHEVRINALLNQNASK